MKAAVLMFSLATLTLVSCKEEVKTTIQAPVSAKPIPANNINVPLPWNLRNVPFGVDFNTACRNYLAIQNGDGC